MSRLPARTAADNPFSTRYVRPGAIPFRFPPGEDARTLIARLAKHDWRGAILGPHGSGKTALLATLVAAIEHLPRRVLRVELHDAQRRLPAEARKTLRESPPEMLVVDGYEQLSRWARWRLAAFCRQGGCGLLVAAHAPVGLPELFRTRVDPLVIRKLVDDLQAEHPPHVAEADVAAAFRQHGTNARELLFELYDLYESRRRGTGAGD